MADDPNALGGFGSYQNLFKAIGAGGINVPTAVETPRNPLAQQMLNQQLQQGQDFASNLQGMSDSLYGNAAANARNQLRTTKTGIKNDYNARGLLSSGGRASAEEGADSDAASNLASTRSQINQGLLGNLQGIDANTFNSASNLAAPGAQTAGIALQGAQNQLSNQQTQQAQTNNAVGQLAGGAGSISGYGLSKAIYGQQQQPAQPGYGSPAAYNTNYMD